MSSIGAYLTRRLGAFKRDERGVSAVEFAIIAPFMILLYLGSVDLSLALSIDRKITSSASAIADLVAQDDEVTDSEMSDILSAGAAIMTPFNAAPLQLRVSSVYMDSDGDVEILWSDARGTTPYSRGQAYSPPSGLLTPNKSVVMVEVSYEYRTLFSQLGASQFDISEVFYLRPRRSLTVARS